MLYSVQYSIHWQCYTVLYSAVQCTLTVLHSVIQCCTMYTESVIQCYIVYSVIQCTIQWQCYTVLYSAVQCTLKVLHSVTQCCTMYTDCVTDSIFYISALYPYITRCMESLISGLSDYTTFYWAVLTRLTVYTCIHHDMEQCFLSYLSLNTINSTAYMKTISYPGHTLNVILYTMYIYTQTSVTLQSSPHNQGVQYTLMIVYNIH